MIGAEGQKKYIEVKANAHITNTQGDATAFKEKAHIEADASAQILTISSIARKEVSTLKSSAMLIEAKQESQSSTNMIPKREHEERLLKQGALKGVMRTSNTVIAGKNGDEILSYFKDANNVI